MQKRLFTLVMLCAFLWGVSIAQDGRDLSQAPTNFNNPLFTYGPTLENPVGTLSESFEGTFPPAGWMLASPDGGTGWEQLMDGTTPLPGWTGGTATVPPGGGSYTAYCTWTTGGATSNDQWLITPQIMDVQPGDSLKFWMLIPGSTNAAYLDSVDVLISTTGTNISDFNVVVEEFFFPAGSADTTWTQYMYDLGSFVTAGSNIYIAFREHVSDNFGDGAAVQLDLVEVTEGGGSGGTTFFDNFDSYIAGQDLACQNPVDWDTWSNNPCGPDDAAVTSAFAYSGANSVVIVQNDDLIKPLGTLTSGYWYISFYVYIPTGKTGYFNTMSEFFGTPQYWSMECYFNAGGAGSFQTGDPDVPFTWIPDQWVFVQVEVDLDNDQGMFYYNGNLIHTWAWTNGTSTGTGPLQLDVNDFFGATANDEMYFDNYWFGDAPVPVELTSFAANVTSQGSVELNWTTATEINNQMFEVERKAQDGEFVKIGYVPGNGTTTEPQEYSFVDNSVQPGVYYYRLKQIDYQGTYEYSPVVEVDVHPPLAFGLEQNYPNPFNPSTNIKFSVAEQTLVKLAVYNVLGEEIQVLKNEVMEAGFYEVSFDASSLPSGMYLYRVETPNYTDVKKMMLTK